MEHEGNEICKLVKCEYHSDKISFPRFIQRQRK